MRMSEALVRLLFAGRWWLAALLAVVTLIAGVGLPRLQPDNSLEVWFVQDDPALEAYHAFQDVFGNDEVVAMVVHAEDGIFTEAGLARVRAISAAAEGVDGVVEVRSIATVTHIRIDETWTPNPLEAPPLRITDVDDVKLSPERLKARVQEDPLLRGTLVSNDLKTALVVARMGAMDDMDAQRDGILAELRAAVDKSGHVPAAGMGVVFSALNVASNRDAGVVGGVSYVLIFGLLWLMFRKVGPVMLTLLVVIVTEVITLGLMGWLDVRINTVTIVLPTLLLIIGIADCVHMLRQVAQRSERDRKERTIMGIADVLWPCLFTSLTTAAGFLALATARMQVVRDLGIYSSVGVLVAFAVSLVAVACMVPNPAYEPQRRSTRWLQSRLVRVANATQRSSREILIVAAAMALVGAWGVSRIVVDTYSIDFFYPKHEVSQDSAFIEDTFGFYQPLEFVVTSPEGMKSADRLAAVAAWQDAMEKDPDVSWSRSITDVAQRMNQLYTDGSAENFTVPPDDFALEQALLFYESSPDNDLDDLVDADWERVRVTVGLRMMSAQGIGAAIDRLTLMAELPEDTTLEPRGYLPLYVTMMDYVVSSQISSFTFAFLVIFTLLAIVFRSIRMALMALPANLLPVFVTLGFMGMAGIRLDVATVTIAAVVQGLVVDDTVHFLYRYRDDLRRTGDHGRAVRETLRVVGVPMTTTTISLVLGFSVLLMATVKTVAYFGILAAIAMGVAWLGDLVVMPALLITLKPKL